MIRLVLQGGEERVAAYARAAERLREVCVVDRPEEGDALVWSGPGLPWDAALSGHPMLLDAPLAHSATDLRRFAAAVRGPLLAGLEARFRPAVRVVREALDAGRLGEPCLVRVHRWGPPPDLSTGLAEDVDLACWLFGRRPTTVFAADGPEGYRQVHLAFLGGGMAVLDHARGLPDGDGYGSLTVIGASGAAHADDHHDMQLLYAGGHPTALRTGVGDAALTALLLEFVSAVREGREPSPGLADALLALKVADVADRSARVGATQDLSEGEGP